MPNAWKQNIIDSQEADQIIEALEAILIDIEAGNIEFSVSMEDIHMNVEAILTEQLVMSA